MRRTLLEVRLREVRRLVEHLRFTMEELQQQGLQPEAEYMQGMQQYSQALLRLHQALGR